MKSLFFLLFLFFIVSCSNNKRVYWCGDHPCVNNKERKAYFKKTMIVEIKELGKKNKTNISELDKVTQQTRSDEAKGNKGEKKLIKQARLEEKKRLKEEKKMAKEIILEEKKIAKKKLKSKKASPTKEADTNTTLASMNISSSTFNKLVEIITNKNKIRPYPDINDIPN